MSGKVNLAARLTNHKTLFGLIGVLLAGLILSACGAPEASELAVGEPAPGFTLPAASGEQVSLSEYRGERPVLLYFHMADG